MKCGLIGEKLTHSYSPEIHKELVGDLYSYELYEISPESLEDFINSRQLDAMNITIPYKKAVIPYLDKISERAQKIGAVNTVVMDTEGRLCGDNTDYYGFAKTVSALKINASGKKALILGSGGASLTAQAVLNDLGAVVQVISRSGKNNYSNIYQRHADADIIVNCSPVGMYPNTGVSLLDLSRFSKLSAVFDMIYNPSKTRLLADAESLGIPNINGLYMLVAQAKMASELFCQGRIKHSDTDIDRITTLIARKTKNIVLIGMPGCGKSTVGACLAQKLGRKFIDTDTLVAERAGMTIPEIFSLRGEEVFRSIEEEVCADVGRLTGCIIATGGGVVTREKNYYSLKQNSDVIFIQRDIDLLSTSGRPISQSTPLSNIYEARLPKYIEFADIEVSNYRSPSDTAVNIISQLDKIYK